ncbi:hypothetical protein Syun_017500 [Stephania yunnanensis]|uniref:Uncharacterized protein n=1 Tax=Stephania yunnanensis TaxID=152371 RepID=A0AAP0J9A8_9MAGN
MARPKTPVSREEAGVEPTRCHRDRGSRRSQSVSYRKEKHNVDVKGKAKATRKRARKGELHDEGSNVAEPRHQDLVIARGESEAHASESTGQSLERVENHVCA